MTPLGGHLSVVRRGRQVFYFNDYGPVQVHDVDDLRTFRLATSQFHDLGLVTQAEIVRTFGVSKKSVLRSVKLFREKGAAGFFVARRTRGPAVLTPPVLERAQELLNQGVKVPVVAAKLGLKRDTLRKAVRAGRLQKPPHEGKSNQES